MKNATQLRNLLIKKDHVIDQDWQERCLSPENLAEEEIDRLIADTSLKDNFDSTPLHYLFSSAQLPLLKKIMQKISSTEWNKRDREGRTLLHWLAFFADRDIIRFAFSDEAPDALKLLYNEKCKNNLSFAHYAAATGDQDIIAFMLSDELPQALHHLREEKDDAGFNFFHAIARRGNKEAIVYALSDAVPQTLHYLRKEKESDGYNFFLFIAHSGNKEAIEYALSDAVPQEFQHMREEKENLGYNFFHILASAGNKESIAYALSDAVPESLRYLREEKSPDGTNFFLRVALSQNKEAIAFVLSDAIPQAFWHMREEKNIHGCNFFHHVASSGNKEMLAFILSNDVPQELQYMREEKTNYDFNLFHEIAGSGNKEAIAFVLSDDIPQELQYMREEKTENGFNFFHQIAASGNKEAIAFALSDDVPENLKYLVEEIDSQGCNFFHKVASSGNKEAIAFLFSNSYPQELQSMVGEKDIFGHNFFHYVAVSGNQKAIDFVFSDAIPTELHALREEKDDDGYNFFHCIVAGGDKDEICFFITQHPDLAKKYWVPVSEEKTLDDIATPDAKPSYLLKKILSDVLSKACHESLSDNEKALLSFFSEEAVEFSKDSAFLSAEAEMYLLNHSSVSSLSTPLLQKINLAIKEKLFCIELKDVALNNKVLHKIINFFPEENFLFFKRKTHHPFIENLRKLLEKLQAKKIDFLESQDAAILLKLWLDTPKSHGFLSNDAHKKIFESVKNFLLKTSTVGAIYSQSTFIEIENEGIITEKFTEYLDSIKNQLLALNLGDDEEKALEILECVRFLANNFETLNTYAITNPGSCFYLGSANQYPFHVESFGTGELLQANLNRMVSAYIDAYNVGVTSGRQRDFFQRASLDFCLDHQIFDLSNWANSYYGIKDIHACIANYVKEYLAYSRFMEDIQDDAQLLHVQPALRFITQHHKDDLCIVDQTYAPQGKIQEEGVALYLEEILGYETSVCPQRTL